MRKDHKWRWLVALLWVVFFSFIIGGVSIIHRMDDVVRTAMVLGCFGLMFTTGFVSIWYVILMTDDPREYSALQPERSTVSLPLSVVVERRWADVVNLEAYRQKSAT